MWRQVLGFLVCSFIFLFAHAASYMCPGTYQYINTGDDIAKVMQACGKPNARVTKTLPRVVQQPTEQWVFRAVSNTKILGYSQHLDQTFDYNIRSRPRIVITFFQNKVVAVSLDSQDVGATDLCRSRQMVTKGMPKSRVLAICGSPEFVNRGMRTINQGMEKVTVWVYVHDQYLPKTVLQFRNGILTSIERK